MEGTGAAERHAIGVPLVNALLDALFLGFIVAATAGTLLAMWR